MATNAVKIPFTEAAAPATPAASKVVIYAKSDGLMYSKDDAGTETLMSGGAGGGSVATDAIWDAAGDLAVGTGANTAARVAIGAAGTILTSNGTTTAWGGAYASFTPTLTADGGNPNLGATGSASGRYTQHGKLVHAYGNIKFEGAGVSAGSGVYEIALPVTAHASSITGAMGTVVLYDDSAGLFNIAATYPLDTGEFRIAIGGTGLVVSNATPWTWAANDQINFMIIYEAA